MSWIRQDEFLGLSGVSGWYSSPVIRDVQIISANLREVATKKFNQARQAFANATATPAFAVA